MIALNIWTAWIGILCGLLVGVAQGLFFHDPHWLGGYGSWRRRLLRLGHISFFGIALLNLAFAVTVVQLGWRPATAVPGFALTAAEVLMPSVCFLAAWRSQLRRLFFLPVGCVLVGVIGLLVGQVASAREPRGSDNAVQKHEVPSMTDGSRAVLSSDVCDATFFSIGN